MDRTPARAYILPQPEAGYLRLSGPDRSAFLQRQTTNDMRLLKPQHAVITALLSPTARLLDVLVVMEEPQVGDEALSLITLPGRREATFRFLKSRIFFMDKVTLTDHSAQVTQIDLFGPQADQILAELGLSQPPLVGEWVLGSQIEPGVYVLKLNPAVGLGYRLVGPVESHEAILSSFASTGVTTLTPQEAEIIRVEMGIPGPVGELNERFTPLETNLAGLISSTKGCYTGQEVIARQVNYDKITRSLVGLRLSGPAGIGASLTIEGKPAGSITSYAESPRLGHIALAVVKHPYHLPGSTLLVDGQAPAAVSALPFEPQA